MSRRSWFALPAVLSVVLVSGACGADVGPSDKKAADEPPATTSLEASAPSGQYSATYVLGATNIADAKPGAKSTSTYTFTSGDCTEDSCTGTVAAPGKGHFTWDGTKLTVVFDDNVVNDKCIDDAGKQVKKSRFTTTTQHRAVLTAGKTDGEPPVELKGQYSQRTRYGDFRGGCKAAGDRAPQHATFTLTLARK